MESSPGAVVAASSTQPTAPTVSASGAPVTMVTIRAPTRLSFDADVVGGAPRGMSFGRTGDGHPGAWSVRAEPGAPSGPNVLAQTDADGTDDRFPVAYADTPSLRDVEVKVACKPVSGKIDQACGIVLRLQDANNYYLTRANALENNVRFYSVKDGRRRQLASFSGPVTTGVWHRYRVLMRGEHAEVFWEDAKVLDLNDTTFTSPGKVGVWTKADSVTYFDDLSITALEP